MQAVAKGGGQELHALNHVATRVGASHLVASFTVRLPGMKLNFLQLTSCISHNIIVGSRQLILMPALLCVLCALFIWL